MLSSLCDPGHINRPYSCLDYLITLGIRQDLPGAMLPMNTPTSPAKLKIMVVEDESIIALDLQMSLEEAGYTVVSVVSSGEEAINRCADLEPDLLLMDVHLEGPLDGIETARHIRRGQDIPVLFLSANVDALTLKRVQSVQAAGYIAKPFDTQSVNRNIAAVFTNNTSEGSL